ncbi:MAG: choline/ethanolamine kinase family protein [Rhodobacterales bacterium]|nr:choline/ethanolamine kinase family protein [Rhodobacterales bacterium]
MPENQTAVHAALQNVPRLMGIKPGDYTTQRLGGLTNLVYRVDTGNELLIVRIPGEGTETYIDRAVELHNATVAADAGISAPILWADGKTGVMISRCIDNIETMTPALFSSRNGAAARAGTAFGKLHRCGQDFQFRFELFAMIDDYLDILSGKDIALPEGYHDIVRAADPIKHALAVAPAPLAPCHCDPLCENFLDDGDRMWIIDWEYSGMNDPMWDLGDLSVEAGFTPDQDTAMMTAYFGRPPTDCETGRMVVYKAMCDLLWTLWGLIQHADGNTAEDFNAYAVTRFNRCRALMEHADFAGHIASIAKTA